MCRALGKTYLTIINLITALLGLVIVGICAYVLIEYSSIDAVLSKTATYVCLGVGIILFFVSLLGCCAAQKQNRCGLFIYIVILLVVAAAQIIGGITIAVYAGDLETNNGNIEDLTSDVQSFVSCSYAWCCYNNVDVPSGDAGPGECTSSTWNSDGFCSVFPDDLQSGSSNCGSVTEYNEALVDWLHDNQRYFAIAAITLGSIELLAVFFATYLMCAKTKEQEEAERLKKSQQNGGQIAYGGTGTNYV